MNKYCESPNYFQCQFISVLIEYTYWFVETVSNIQNKMKGTNKHKICFHHVNIIYLNRMLNSHVMTDGTHKPV